MKLDVLNIDGASTGRSVNLPSEVFGQEPNDHAIYLAVKQYQAHQRQGTHKAKERGEIAGSTRKFKKQKGTGTARMGSLKNPLFRSGGRVFGPRPKKYTIALNKKVKSIARNSALSTKFNAGNVMVLEDFTFEAPATGQFSKVLQNLEVADQKVVLVLSDIDKNLQLSSQNIKKAKVVQAKDLNVYEIMNAGKLVLAESSVEKIKEIFA
jgi:large subunit ribosomal protein L4